MLKDGRGRRSSRTALIIATGASANYLGLESEEKYKNHGVCACAVCDGALPRFRNKPLVVVGGGDSACEEGHYLTKFASKVHLVHRRDKMRASHDHGRADARQPEGQAALEPRGRRSARRRRAAAMTGVRMKNLKTGETQTIDAAGMFVAIGHTPNTKFLNGQLETDDKGFIVLKDPFRTTTSVEGVFAAGDVADPIYKQAITAAGHGLQGGAGRRAVAGGEGDSLVVVSLL